ncbi:MAG: enoyl-CoA hydratase/isomerase family protein [Pseudomonadota bacterium]|nr:enoyl-CoA hydratase/isomerase family protein [Pseudomonadota bacterium]
MTEDVITRIEGAVGRITLNRPKALHALNTAMCAAMTEALVAWRRDPKVELVLLDHSGERGFCAGGDIRMLAESGAKDAVEAREFFHTEYRLNALLESYPKRTVAVMDGIVMGGGVGLSLPCDDRIATERTAFAMPETGIGLFPDVGGGWWLPRMPGETGLWLALTGARIKAADCLLLGIATDFVESARLDALKAAIVADPAALDTLLTEYEADAGEPPLAAHQDVIDACFAASSVEAIFQALREDGSDWAIAQHDILLAKSPQTLKVACRQLREGRGLKRFADNMAMEYRIGARVVQRPDFLEGVRAVIIDKDNQPKWSPATVEGVSAALLDEIFAPLPSAEEWTPLS